MTLLKNSFLALFLLSLLVVVGTGCSGSVAKTFSTKTPNASAPVAAPGSASSTASASGAELAAAPAASSAITVSSPANGASVDSPFNLSATATNCSSQPVTAMAYSIDDGTDSGIVSGGTEATPVSSQTGAHTLHVKAWGAQGAVCVQDVAVAVKDTGSPENGIPSNAIRASDLQNATGWRAAHDSGTGSGTASSGSMSVVGSPSMSGNARQFDTSFSNSGGEIYNLVFSNDTNATNFFYDAWVYLTNSASNVANLEMDMNQVMPNGQTVIYGFQCDGYTNTWDYTANQGTATHPDDVWIHSGAYCNPASWGKEQWHHVQVSYSRDDSGNVSYHSVWLDGTEQKINATVSSSFALGWAPALVTNLQVDGRGSGSNTVYLDKLTISRW